MRVFIDASFACLRRKRDFACGSIKIGGRRGKIFFAHDFFGVRKLIGSCAQSICIATVSRIPDRTKVLTAAIRKSWRIPHGTPAALQAPIQIKQKSQPGLSQDKMHGGKIQQIIGDPVYIYSLKEGTNDGFRTSLMSGERI
jgi:hypothetical protein